MLELPAARTGGTLPYLVPVAHTEIARARLGPEALLAVEQAVVLDPAPRPPLSLDERPVRVDLAGESAARPSRRPHLVGAGLRLANAGACSGRTPTPIR